MEDEDSGSNADARHTCLKLELPSASGRSKDSIFIRGIWFPSHFHLTITDGLHAWTCEGSDAEVRQRAEQWDQSVSEYIGLAERYLGFQQPDSKYGFEDAGNGHMRLSWTFEKQGTKLEWSWKCQPSSESKQNIVEILDFLMDANIRLSVNHSAPRHCKRALNREPTMVELHARTHQRQQDQQWVDQRSQRAYEDYLRVSDERRSQPSSGEPLNSRAGSSNFDTWEEVAGGRKKRRIYGIGSVAQTVACSQSSYSVDSLGVTLEALLQKHMATMQVTLQEQLLQMDEQHERTLHSLKEEIATLREQVSTGKQKEVIEQDSDPERNVPEEDTESE